MGPCPICPENAEAGETKRGSIYHRREKGREEKLQKSEIDKSRITMLSPKALSAIRCRANVLSKARGVNLGASGEGHWVFRAKKIDQRQPKTEAEASHATKRKKKEKTYWLGAREYVHRKRKKGRGTSGKHGVTSLTQLKTEAEVRPVRGKKRTRIQQG